jgi:hypothetical protein
MASKAAVAAATGIGEVVVVEVAGVQWSGGVQQMVVWWEEV